MEWLTKVMALTPPTEYAGIAFVVGGLMEFIVGWRKSERPVRVAYLIANTFMGIGQLFIRWGAFLDKILPQRLKEPKLPEV